MLTSTSPNWALVVRIVFGFLAFIGILLNGLVFWLLIHVKVGSNLTTILLRHQCLFDGLSCLIALISKITGPILLTWSRPFNVLLCHVWSRDSLFWLGAVLSMHNMVYISLDRLTATFFPTFYRFYRKSLLIGYYIYLTSAVCIIYVPVLFNRRFENETCLWYQAFDSDLMHPFYRIHGYIWILFKYALPAMFIMLAHILILCMVFRRRPQRCMEVQFKKLVWTTVMLSSSSTILHLPDAGSYASHQIGTSQYDAGGISHQLRLLCITVCYCINPSILLGMTTVLQDSAKERLLRCRKCRKYGASTDQAIGDIENPGSLVQQPVTHTR
ncbi:hypothetical protein CSKR_106859 [Clonorchis sinensis]|uniref:Uncharacterized protein n=2 Tax=Clonorchis sinensis TaxID=79923 RepID=A0A8T1MG51_CLOSI|nr:hypothetical protein CSKR_106859 [Clonorchis sinensis]GAA36474.1 amine GPCR [Clonorchis sinensis]